jgi:hypothetical protein
MNWKILLGALMVFGSNGNPPVVNSPASQPKPYEGLKRMAYAVKYEQLHLPDAHGKRILYGVLMDWDYEGKATVTLVSFATGDASLYLSTGTIIIGGGHHAEVAEASKGFIQAAGALLPQANSADTALRIEPGMLKFYLLTNKGKYVIKDKIDNVYNRTSMLTGLFGKANELIGAIQRVTPASGASGGGH